MQTRRLGQTEIEVSVLGLGTVKFGRNQGVKYPREFALPSDQELGHLLAAASEVGINLLDTAPAYGSSEERLGSLLQGQRQRWIISTKAGEEFVNGESHFDFSPRAIRASVERSLRRLNTDYLDIVLAHSSGDDVGLVEQENIFTTLNELKQSGKIRAYGMSTKTVAGGLLTVEHADVAMVTLNPAATEDRQVIASAQQKNKGIFIKKALGSGHLPAAEALKFALNEPGVSSVIVGTINVAHLLENAAAL